jgi:phosphoribosylanthranilate isomerase
MRSAENIRQVAALNPAYMGFIFYRDSKRFVGQGFRVPDDFPSSIRRVGVFVNEKNFEIRRLSVLHGLDFVQLHGEESVASCFELRNEGLGVIKVFPAHDLLDFRGLELYKNAVDYFMFDTKGPGYGGSGKTFNWNILEAYDQEIPFFLSGGISQDKIKDVGLLKGMNLHALDINSGVERIPGWKDADLIKKVKNEMMNL